jgi:hypothetical protein
MSNTENTQDKLALNVTQLDLRSRAIPRSADTELSNARTLHSSAPCNTLTQTKLTLLPDKLCFNTPPKPTAAQRQVAVTLLGDTTPPSSRSAMTTQRDDRTERSTEQLAELQDALHRATRRAEIAERDLGQLNDRHFAGANRSKPISDSIVAPKPFLGKPDQQDPIDWLDFFNRFCAYKHLNDEETINLFSMMMRDGASDWFQSYIEPRETPPSYEEIQDAFRDNYFKSKELRWKDASALFNQSQAPTERTEDYITRMRKLARRLEFSDEVLHMAIINGLRAPIRMHVAQQGLKSLDDTIKAAKIAEATTASVPDTLTSTLLEMLKTSVQASEKQANELQQLTNRVASLSSVVPHQTNETQQQASGTPAPRQNFGQRFTRVRPQTFQRANYAQQPALRRGGGPRSFNSPPTACGNCGLQHTQGNCPARQQECRHCGRVGHFARVCRSARLTSN